MRFSILTALAALCSVAVAQLSVNIVVTNVNALTDKCKALVVPAQQISITNAPLLLLGQGPWGTVVTGFAGIVVDTTTFVTVLRERSQSTKYTGSDATAIADAVRLFFAALHDLLSVVIGKAGFLTKIPFIGPPITSVLRSVEGVVDAFVQVIIELLEDTVGAAVESGYKSLETTIQSALTSYAPV